MEESLPERICPHCGGRVAPEKHTLTKYCSRTCQNRSAARRQYLRNRRARRPKGEAEGVNGKELAEVLTEWRKVYETVSGITEKTDYGKQETTSTLEYLTVESGVPKRRVWGFLKGESNFVSLTQAEKILMATDQYYMLSNGTLHIIPNPNWSVLDWIEYMQNRGCY